MKRLFNACFIKKTLHILHIHSLAIRRNIDSVETMKKAIMATYYHISSTEENPKHENCPRADSWCFYNKSLAIDPTLKSVKHPDPIKPDVAKHILPIFEDLSRDELLENESFNATIWRMTPKHLYSGLQIVNVACWIVQ